MCNVIPDLNHRIYFFTKCQQTSAKIAKGGRVCFHVLVRMRITYCEEEHAVHSEGGVARVEGQSDEGEEESIKQTMK